MSETELNEWGEQDEWGNDLVRLRYVWSLTPLQRLERNTLAARNIIALRKAKSAKLSDPSLSKVEERDREDH